MVNKCALLYCKTGRVATDEKKSLFHFPLQDPEINEKWEHFVSRKGFKATQYSVICEVKKKYAKKEMLDMHKLLALLYRDDYKLYYVKKA